MTLRTQSSVAQAITSTLDQLPVAAVFVYGSVATGTERASSDLDTFVLLAEEIGPTARRRTAAQFCQLQLFLGFQPDREHPVELFTIAHAAKALDVAELAAIDGSLDALAIGSDEREVLGALSGPRLIIHTGPDLDYLTARAVRLARLLAAQVPA